MENAYLFVYGTLRKGFSLSIPEKITADIEWIGRATIKGILYDIGQYPGAIPESSTGEMITGEILSIKNPDKVFEFLDHYEGVNMLDPVGCEYVRKEETIVREDGSFVKAWVYWYNFDISGKNRIADNDYIKYLQKNQLA